MTDFAVEGKVGVLEEVTLKLSLGKKKRIPRGREVKERFSQRRNSGSQGTRLQKCRANADKKR